MLTCWSYVADGLSLSRFISSSSSFLATRLHFSGLNFMTVYIYMCVCVYYVCINISRRGRYHGAGRGGAVLMDNLRLPFVVCVCCRRWLGLADWVLWRHSFRLHDSNQQHRERGERKKAVRPSDSPRLCFPKAPRGASMFFDGEFAPSPSPIRGQLSSRIREGAGAFWWQTDFFLSSLLLLLLWRCRDSRSRSSIEIKLSWWCIVRPVSHATKFSPLYRIFSGYCAYPKRPDSKLETVL